MNMQIINKIIFRYLSYGLIPVIPLLVWASLMHPESPGNTNTLFVKILWEVLSWNFIIWFLCLFYFFILLLVSSKTREGVFTRLTRMKERDEREEIISAKASKFSFISMLSMMLFMFFISGLQISMVKNNPERVNQEKKGTLSIGYKFSFEKSPVTQGKNFIVNKNEMHYKGIPFSMESILLFLLLWQIGSYHFYVKRYNQMELNEA